MGTRDGGSGKKFAASTKKTYLRRIFELTMKPFETIGHYVLLMRRTFTRPQQPRMFWRQVLNEVDNLGLSSLFIVVVSSLFMGAVMTMQTDNNTENPLLPAYSLGLVTRDTLLLEFCSTVMSLFLAGQIGSHIASEIGTMRITEQIDAMEIMGVNSANYIILPKITAVILYMPVLVVISMFCGMVGGWGFCFLSGEIPVSKYIYGIRYAFIEWYVWYAIIKSLFFAFIITSVSAYNGYFVKGGALEVGKAGTMAVVSSSILVLIFDLLLTQILL